MNRFRRRESRTTNAELLNKVSPAPVKSPDVRLLTAAARGDREARRQLFERYRDIAYRVALRVTGRPEDALDVVQDSFIRAFERLGEFQGEAGFQTWLLRIVSNRALDVLRARKVRLAVPLDAGEADDPRLEPAAPEQDNHPGRALESRETVDRIRGALERLPADQRVVFSLYATGEMTYAQIADVLGIPIGTVMSRLFHARRRLHDLLPDLCPTGRTRENSEPA